MTRFSTAAFLAGLFAWSAGDARAEPIWSYRGPGNESVKTTGSSAGLTFPNSGFATGSGDQSILATGVVAWSVAGADAPDAVVNASYSFALELSDSASGQTGSMSFAGVLDGMIWKDGTRLANTFVGPTTGSLDLGDYRYTVALDLFTAPTGFGDARAGAITADVTVAPLSDPTSVPEGSEDPISAQTPEPGTVVLAGVGAVSVMMWRPRRDHRGQRA